MPLFVALFAHTAAASVGPRCRTPEVRAQRLAAPAPPPYASPSMSRPAEAGFVDSTRFPIRVHYRRAADAARAAEVLLPVAEDAWHDEIEVMGWPAPPADYGVGGSDAYDLYLTDEDTDGGAFTTSTYDRGAEPDTDPTDAYYSNSSWIALDEGIPDELLPEFVAHELDHALQYGIDAGEASVFAWESTAEAIAELHTGDNAFFTDELPDFQSHPDLSVLFDAGSDPVAAYGDTGMYEYGGWMFGAWLEQAVGDDDGRTLLRVWQALAAPGPADDPDFVDALGTVAGDDAFLGFTEWRMLVAGHDDGAHFDDGADWPAEAAPAVEGRLALSELDGATVTPDEPVYAMGNSFWEIDVDAPGALHLELTGDAGTRWGLVVAALGDGPARVVKAPAKGDLNGVQIARLDVDPAGARTLLVGVADLGPADLSATRIPAPDRYALSFAKTGVVATAESGDTTEAGDTAEDADPGATPEVATGCSSTGLPASAAGALAAALILRRRAR